MVEIFDNTFQIVMLLLCVFISLYRAVKTQSKAWLLLLFFFGSHAMSELYLVLCLVFYGSMPQVSTISDLNSYAAYLFLYLLLRQLAPPETAREKRLLPWLGFVFTLAMAGFFFSFYIVWTIRDGEHYVLWEKALTNLIYGMLMGLILFSAIRRLMDAHIYRAQRSLCIVILVFCMLEYALWTTSCFWFTYTLKNPYVWFDILLTVSYLFFLPAMKKAVAE